jgi:hypothetical protein
VNVVATGDREVLDDVSGVESLDINFWTLASAQQSGESPDFSVPVNIPSNWTSQLYLDALSHSVERYSMICCMNSKAVIGIGRYNTVNNLHALYQLDLATVQEIIS